MKRPRPWTPYALTGALFVGIGLGGMLFFGWGEVRLAFLLLIYCLLVVGYRLDDIGRQLGAIDRRLAEHLGPPAAARPDAGHRAAVDSICPDGVPGARGERE
jgi:hypothetical protein